MDLISRFITGGPLTPNRSAGLATWKKAIVSQTQDLPPVEGACRVRVQFQLTDEAFRTAPPFGPDLDNLLKPLMDSLKQTIFARLGDECVIEVVASKAGPGTYAEPGVRLDIEPVADWAIAT